MTTQMIGREGDSRVQCSELTDYVDPHFKKKPNMVRVTSWMAQKGISASQALARSQAGYMIGNHYGMATPLPGRIAPDLTRQTWERRARHVRAPDELPEDFDGAAG